MSDNKEVMDKLNVILQKIDKMEANLWVMFDKPHKPVFFGDKIVDGVIHDEILPMSKEIHGYSDTDMLTVREVSGILGVSEASLNQWRHIGHPKLAFTKDRHSIRYKYSDVITFKESYKRRKDYGIKKPKPQVVKTSAQTPKPDVLKKSPSFWNKFKKAV